MSNKTLALMWVFVLLSACFEKQEVNVPDGHLVKSASGVAHPEWLVTSEAAKTWAEAKQAAGGHTLPGSPSWKTYMRFLEGEFKNFGMIDMFKHQWSFDRWFTSEMPDHSKWSLVVGGKDIPAANYAAFSGLTPPGGVKASIVFYDESQPPKDIKGKIVVFKTKPSPKDADMDKTFETLFTWHDYEYLSDGDSFPPIHTVVTPDKSVVFDNYYQLKQVRAYRDILKKGQAAGGLFILNGGYERLAGIESFIVPNIYGVPVLILDENAGAQVIAAAKSKKKATLRLEAKTEKSEIYQLYGYLPGKNYGTSNDEFVLLCTHTDGPSVSQENGAIGLLGITQYFSRFPKEERNRTLLLFLDSRHYYPGAEWGSREHDFIPVYPDVAKKVVASMSMEHLGQYEFREKEGKYERTGQPEGVLLWSRNNQKLIDAAIASVKNYALPRTRVTNVERPGVNGQSQGIWYGIGAIALATPNDVPDMPTLNVPGYALLGGMGGYWTTMSQIQNFDPELFVKQVAVATELTEMLMTADLNQIKPID